MTDTFGSRGGNVADLDRARALHEVHKREWTQAVKARIRRAFREQATVHADDIDDIGLPAEHRNIIGGQLGSLVSSGAIVEVDRRKSSNPARRGAKSSVYALTDEGRRRLLEGTVTDKRGGAARFQPATAAAPVSAPTQLALVDPPPQRPSYLDPDLAA